MARLGLEREEFLGEQDRDRVLPWDIVESGVTDTFFDYEWRRAQRRPPGPPCPPATAGLMPANDS